MATDWRGLDLARALYLEVVEPALAMPHAACLIGEGSDVLGYDTGRSADHEWGPRLQVFVSGASIEQARRAIEEALPDTFHGLPTRWFSLAAGRVAHHVEVDSAESWLARRLPTLPRNPDHATWLAAPQQHLLQLTAGEVFRDDIGVLGDWRATYSWYPQDLWRWLIASQWHLIGNTEPLLGRTIETGDGRGARLLTARLCHLVMGMAYLQQRRYQPYAKWFGAGFRDLPAAEVLGPLLDAALDEQPSPRQDGPMQQALLSLGAGHNALQIGGHVDPTITDFAVGINDAIRPYPVLNTAAFIESTVAAITDHALARLPRVGAVDQLTHGDDLLINFSSWPADLADNYRRMLTQAGRS